MSLQWCREVAPYLIFIQQDVETKCRHEQSHIFIIHISNQSIFQLIISFPRITSKHITYIRYIHVHTCAYLRGRRVASKYLGNVSNNCLHHLSPLWGHSWLLPDWRCIYAGSARFLCSGEVSRSKITGFTHPFFWTPRQQPSSIKCVMQGVGCTDIRDCGCWEEARYIKYYTPQTLRMVLRPIIEVCPHL